MLTLTVATWSEGRGPSKCGIEIDSTRYSTEDPDEITSREEAEAAGIPTALLDEYRGIWGLFGVWLEDKAICSTPISPKSDLQKFSQRLAARQSSIRSTIAKLMEGNKSQS